MKLQTLDEFIILHRNLDKIYYRRNEWVDEAKFESLYVRYGARYIRLENSPDDPIHYEGVLDIANVTVEEQHRGQGVFTNLITRLQKDYPGMHIFIEIASPRFQTLLRRLEFSELDDDCFFLKGAL